MPQDEPRFEIPADVTAARDRLDDRYYLALGRALSRVVSTVSNTNEQELAGAFLAAMQETLTLLRAEDTTLIERLVQRAYAAGRTDGMEELGRQLGMIQQDAPTPDITH